MDAVSETLDLVATGVRHLTATAQDAFGTVSTASLTFRVVATGEGNNTTLPHDPPAVISNQTLPANDAVELPITTVIQMVFTEPVVNVAANVRLREVLSGAELPLRILAVTPLGEIVQLDAQGVGNVAVTALTIEPLVLLKADTRYRLTVSDGVADLDPIAKHLSPAPFITEFETVRPRVGGSADQFGSAGIALVDTRAYLAENNFTYGYLRAFDVTDADAPVQLPSATARVFGRPMGIAAQGGADGETHEVAIVTGPPNTSIPSNLYLFDVQNARSATPVSHWVAAATLSPTAQQGTVSRVALHGTLA
jgi:hypothetical protein